MVSGTEFLPMSVQLRNPNSGFPRDGFTFSDPHTGMRFDNPYDDLNHLIKRVQEHRKANPKIYPETDTVAVSFDRVKEEILIQLCSNQPGLCEDSAHPGREYPYVAPEPPPAPADIYRQHGKMCPRCQFTEFTIVYCRSCGSSRVSGYRCNKCGFES